MNRALRSFHVLFCATALVAVAAAPLACEAGSRDAFAADAAPPGTDSAMTQLAPPDTTPDARALAFVGDTTLGYDGVTISTALVMARRDLEVETQTWPPGAARTVTLHVRREAGALELPMILDRRGGGPHQNNEVWRAVVPAAYLVADAKLEYWIAATDATGQSSWDNRGGANYPLVPNEQIELFDGRTLVGWAMAGRGAFEVVADALSSKPGDGLGLLWSRFPMAADFDLAMDVLTTSEWDNSGIFVRFRDPESFGYENTAWAAVHDGLEVQIDDKARPAGAAHHRTGAFYEMPGQSVFPLPASTAGAYRRFVVRARGHAYTVSIDGAVVCSYTFAGDPARTDRAAMPARGAPRFFGLQAHTGNVRFRNVHLSSPR